MGRTLTGVSANCLPDIGLDGFGDPESHIWLGRCDAIVYCCRAWGVRLLVYGDGARQSMMLEPPDG